MPTSGEGNAKVGADSVCSAEERDENFETSDIDSETINSVGSRDERNEFEEPESKRKRANKEIELEKRRLKQEREQLELQRERSFQMAMKSSGSNSTRLESVPEFNSATSKITTLQWIDTLEQLGEANNWTETNKIYHMQSRLRGTAKSWYEGYDNYLQS